MDNRYAIQLLKWAMYKFYEPISAALAIYQLIEADYNLDSYAGNIKAVQDYLHFTSFKAPEVIHTTPDARCDGYTNRNPRRGMTFKSVYQDTIIYAEMKHPRYNRSMAQLNLEDHILTTGNKYYTVTGLADLLHQLQLQTFSDTPQIADTS